MLTANTRWRSSQFSLFQIKSSKTKTNLKVKIKLVCRLVFSFYNVFDLSFSISNDIIDLFVSLLLLK